MTTPTSETVIPAQIATADVTSPVVTTDDQPVVSSPVVESAEAAAAAVDANAPAPIEVTPPVDDSVAPKTTPKWAQERINDLTAKRYAAERETAAERARAEAAEELLARVTQPAAGAVPAAKPTAAAAAPAQPVTDDQEIERRVNQRAAQMAAQKNFNDACNKVADTGAKEYKDWGDALKNLTMVGAVGQGAPIDFLQTAIELQAPHKVLHYLGTNLDEAKRITELPPTKMALEMARLEATLNAPAPAVVIPVSNAPAPIIPVGGAAKPGTPDINDPNLAPEDWFALRQKQIEERRNRYTRH